MKEIKSLNKLIDCFRLFPSVGEKSAERMAYALLDMSADKIDELETSIKDASTKIHQCPICGLLTEDKICGICSNPNRDHSICIVLAYPKDVLAFEKLENYHGVYHVLGGVISSLHGTGPENLKIDELRERINKEGIKEIIIATNPNMEGETTALYLTNELKDMDIKISRLAYGIPMGGQLDYIDELTMSKAIDGRQSLKK
ncbi:MAG: recombination mediator RecR [Bacilli bacterium]